MILKLAALSAGIVLALAGSNAVAEGAEQGATAPMTAEVLPLVLKQGLFLDFAEATNRAIAVGERGHVAVSESRSDWRQVDNVPTRANLTAVAAFGDRAWAVGHDGVILASEDGGLTWKVQREDRWQPLPEDDLEAEFDPTQGAPLLDVIALDANTVIAVGAYSLMLVTRDGGSTWTRVDPNAQAGSVPPADEAPLAADAEPDAQAASENEDWLLDDDSLMLDEEEDPHLNGITRTPEGALMVVAERGAAFRSLDNGMTWQRISLPYEGSMFGVLALGERHVLAYGLRGNVQESTDMGDTWTELGTGTELSLQGGTVLADGGVLLVGSNGVLLHRDAGAAEFTQEFYINERQETPVLSAVLPISAREVLVAGEKGLGRTQLK
jgi:photosystem II stability/assembly factor-like uncharacterized protein